MLTIIGLDPGTTLGYAILDLNGNVLRIGSTRDTSSTIREIIQHGRPVVVSTDVCPVPRLVAKFATITGARMVVPKRNLKTETKKFLTQDYRLNSHERDALSAAFFAYRRIARLMARVDSHLLRADKTHLADDVKEVVISSSLSISDAVSLLERKDAVKKTGKRKRQDISIIEPERKVLSSRIEELEAMINGLKTDKERLLALMDEIVERRVQNRLKNSNKNMQFLRCHVEELRIMAENLEKENCFLFELLMDRRYAPVKKAANLIRPVSEEIMVVENPNIYTEEGIDGTCAKTLICIERPSKKVAGRLHAHFINLKDIDFKTYKDCYFVNMESLKEESVKADMIKRIVLEYKKERLGYMPSR